MMLPSDWEKKSCLRIQEEPLRPGGFMSTPTVGRVTSYQVCSVLETHEHMFTTHDVPRTTERRAALLRSSGRGYVWTRPHGVVRRL